MNIQKKSYLCRAFFSRFYITYVVNCQDGLTIKFYDQIRANK